jgi:site-specific DNA recombinase
MRASQMSEKSYKARLKLFFRRVSTENQSLEMQMAADKKYRDALDEDEYIELNELGVSANKLTFKQRDKMQEIMTLIENREVKELYVYDRSRLTRNFYEYLELVDLFITHDVDIYFTTTDSSYSPFTSNYLVEAINGILIEEEGRAIVRRVADSNRKLPARKFGYEVEKHDGKKEYFLKSDLKMLIEQVFKKASEVKKDIEFLELLSFASKTLKRKPVDIIRMLTDAFYAGCERESEHHFITLSYVEPVVTKETFVDIQQNIKFFVEKVQLDRNERSNENMLQPHCSTCFKKMNYKVSSIGEAGTYSCSNKHKKVTISLDVYNGHLLKSALAALTNLSKVELKNTVQVFLQQKLSALEKEIQTLEKKVEDLELKIATSPIDRIISKHYKIDMEILNEIKKKKRSIKEQTLHIENYKINVQQLVLMIEENIMNKLVDIPSIVGLLVKECFVGDSEITLNLFFNEFLDKKEVERMMADA